MNRVAQVLGFVSVLGCASKPQAPVELPPATPSGDQLFAAGRYGDAVVAYGRELVEAETIDGRAKARLFRALARLAKGEPRAEGVSFEELRGVEHDYPQLVWGRIARLFVDEIARGNVLRDAVMQAGAEVREVEQRIRGLEEAMTQAQALTAEQQEALADLREERSRLQRQLKDAEEQAAAQAARIVELEQELGALKRIDMERQP